MRRGAPSTWSAFGERVATASGDCLFALAFSELAREQRSRLAVGARRGGACAHPGRSSPARAALRPLARAREPARALREQDRGALLGRLPPRRRRYDEPARRVRAGARRRLPDRRRHTRLRRRDERDGQDARRPICAKAYRRYRCYSQRQQTKWCGTALAGRALRRRSRARRRLRGTRALARDRPRVRTSGLRPSRRTLPRARALGARPGDRGAEEMSLAARTGKRDARDACARRSSAASASTPRTASPCSSAATCSRSASSPSGRGGCGRGADEAYFVRNLTLNQTNVCRVKCRFCAFARSAREEGAYTLSPAELAAEAGRAFELEPFNELHLVNGESPQVDLRLVPGDGARAARGAARRAPQVLLGQRDPPHVHALRALLRAGARAS